MLTCRKLRAWQVVSRQVEAARVRTTSAHAAMPQAAIDRAGAINHVVALDEVAGLLMALASAPNPSTGVVNM